MKTVTKLIPVNYAVAILNEESLQKTIMDRMGIDPSTGGKLNIKIDAVVGCDHCQITLSEQPSKQPSKSCAAPDGPVLKLAFIRDGIVYMPVSDAMIRRGSENA